MDSLLSKEQAEVVAASARLRVAFAQGVLEHAFRPTVQAYRLGGSSLILPQHSQIVQSESDVGVLSPEAPLVNGEGAPHQRFGLCQTVSRLKEAGKIAETSGNAGMIRP